MEIERTKELSCSLSQSQRKAVLSILRADAFSHCQDPVLTTRGWLLRLRPSFSGSCARRGSERASGSVIDGPGQEGAIAGRPANDHWMNLPSSGRIQPTILTVSQISVSIASSAAWATRERRCQSSHQSPSHRCNRVRNVAFRPQRRILWAGNLRVRQIAGRAWWHELLRGESSLARRSGIRRPQCKGWRDGGSRANPVLQNVPARPPA
jgi:hypothetical protein